MANRINSTCVWLVGIISLGILLKAGLLISGAFPFNSDEAIVGLMGRHILAGERPIFFYGQAYMGSLDAFIVAAFFKLFGQAVWVIRFVQTLLFTFTIFSTFWLGKVIFNSDKTGLLAAALVAVPAVNVTLYTTVSLGGYGEALLLGNLILLIAIWIAKESDPQGLPAICLAEKKITYSPRDSNIFGKFWIPTLIFGFLIGLGLWTNGLTLVYSGPAIFYVFLKRWKTGAVRDWRRVSGDLAAVLAAFIVGSFPVWIYMVKMGPDALFREYLGSAVAVETGSWLAQAINHFINFLLLGVTAILGMRPPWAVTWLILPLAPLVLIFWGWAIAYVVKIIIKRKEVWGEMLLLTGVLAIVVLGFVATPFGNDPSGRYFLPFGVILALVAAGKINSMKMKWGRWHWGLAFLLFTYYLAGNMQCAITAPQSFTTQFDASTIIDHRYDNQLIQFLKDNNEVRGYANYWITYPIAFLSNEELIFTPRLPYHQDFRYTSRDDRYSPYDAMVAASGQVAIITAHFQALDDQIRRTLISEDITWKEKVIGDYRVFYNLSKPIRPGEFRFVMPGS